MEWGGRAAAEGVLQVSVGCGERRVFQPGLKVGRVGPEELPREPEGPAPWGDMSAGSAAGAGPRQGGLEDRHALGFLPKEVSEMGMFRV